ncbi:hypothetical protein [Paenibacillus kribbensis]|uniref:hypothetical protein n=1 Tax=Paenibacillus kribbensis TaxID=172713 RepID=UPI000838A38F|nr:hypothetical protein [Paenibacillus kribbensis]
MLKRIDIRQAGARNKLLIGDLDGDGRMELVLVQGNGGIDDRYVPHQVQCITAYDLDGHLLWQKGAPDPEPGRNGSDFPAQIADIDGDGCNEVLCVMDGRFRILEGRSGREKRSFALPGEMAHDCIMITNISGHDWPSDILLKDRYHTLWVLDRHFNLLWTHEGNPGHFPWAHDWDGDGRDEVMAGYDMLDHEGKLRWSCRGLEDHADCIWVGDVAGDGRSMIVIGGSVTVMYDADGQEIWRYSGSVESQHVALGKFRADLPGLQIAGVDRIIRGDAGDVFSETGRDALFLLDQDGRQLWKEERTTAGWLTIAETVRHWDEERLDYILAYRRGGGVLPALYNGYMEVVTSFPVDGLAAYADLTGAGFTHVVLHDDEALHIFANRPGTLDAARPGQTLKQSKRLYSSTLYPGGEYE